MKEKHATVAQYLASVSPDKRAALQKLRKTLKAAAPGSEECISYGIPALRLRGKFFVGFGAGRDHCSLYPGAAAVELHKKELEPYSTSKGTIRFQPGRPLPASLVRKLLKTRLADMAG